MASEQLHLTKLLEAIRYVLNVFNLSNGSLLIERAAANRDDESNNIQLLANLKEELTQLPPLTNTDMNGEMCVCIQALINSISAIKVIDKKFLARSVNKLYHALEQFARNEIQRSALIEMQIMKEDVLGIEPRHRVAHKLKTQAEKQIQYEEENRNDEDLHMTRQLKSADY